MIPVWWGGGPCNCSSLASNEIKNFSCSMRNYFFWSICLSLQGKWSTVCENVSFTLFFLIIIIQILPKIQQILVNWAGSTDSCSFSCFMCRQSQTTSTTWNSGKTELRPVLYNTVHHQEGLQILSHPNVRSGGALAFACITIGMEAEPNSANLVADMSSKQ